MDWQLFASTFGLIFLAEIPDKTALAIVLLASQKHPWAVFFGVCSAFAVQSLVAVVFGRALGLLPPQVVHTGAALMFFVFALLMWFRREEAAEIDVQKAKGTFAKAFQSSFIVVFIAEWGDLTQLATAALEAKFHKPYLLYAAATSALWAATGLLVLVGHYSKRFINPGVLRRVAAVTFALVGGWMAYSAWKG